MSLFEDWQAWDLLNPTFYPVFKGFARQLIVAGRQHFGAKMIFERIRWDVAIRTRGEEWKLNNNYPAFYARLFEADTGLTDHFEKRVQDEEIPPNAFVDHLARRAGRTPRRNDLFD